MLTTRVRESIAFELHVPSEKLEPISASSASRCAVEQSSREIVVPKGRCQGDGCSALSKSRAHARKPDSVVCSNIWLLHHRVISQREKVVGRRHDVKIVALRELAVSHDRLEPGRVEVVVAKPAHVEVDLPPADFDCVLHAVAASSLHESRGLRRHTSQRGDHSLVIEDHQVNIWVASGRRETSFPVAAYDILNARRMKSVKELPRIIPRYHPLETSAAASMGGTSQRTKVGRLRVLWSDIVAKAREYCCS